MENTDIKPMKNPPRFDPKTERYRHRAIRFIGALWVFALGFIIYLINHWVNCPH